MKRLKQILCLIILVVPICILFSENVSANNLLGNMIPIHSFTFDNDNGNTVVDSITGSTVSGTATGATIVTGYNESGSARSFNGSSYIAFNESVIPAGEKSISFKIRKSSTSEIATGVSEYIFANTYDSYHQSATYGCLNTDGKLKIVVCEGGNHAVVISSMNICDDNWHNILYTWDGTTDQNAIKLYVDDMENPNSTATSSFTQTAKQSYNLYIGSLSSAYTASTAINFIGDLDDFNVYNNAYIPTTPSSTLKVVLGVGESLQLSVNNDLDVNAKMTWSSDDDSIATVDANGITTGVKSGSTVITVTNADGTYKETINLLVINDETDLQLAIDLRVGDTRRLTVDDLTDTVTATWSSNSQSVATVSDTGKVTAIGVGTTYVTATDDQGNEIGKILVRVRK